MKYHILDLWNSFILSFMDFLPKLAGAVLTLLVGYWLIRLALWFIKRQLNRFVDKTIHGFLLSASKILLWTLLILCAAGVLGINTTSFIAALGAAGLAVGLALQSSLSNLASGIILLFNKSFRIGDYIEIAGVSGTVINIDLMFTSINTSDNKRIVIPNSILSGNALINYSHNDMRRVDMTFDISHRNNVKEVKALVLDVITRQEKIYKNPKPLVEIQAYGSNSVQLVIHIWCKTDDYWDNYFYMNEEIKLVFEQNNISIPCQQMDVRVFPPLD